MRVTNNAGARLDGPAVTSPAAIGLAAVLTVWLVLLWRGPESAVQWLSNVALLGMALIAAASCWWAAHRFPGRMRLTWMLFGLACASWAGGQIAWSTVEYLDGDPFATAVDVGYLAFFPFAIGALIAIPARRSRLTSVARALVDGLVIASSLLFVSWALVLADIHAAGGSGLDYVIGLVYPIGDVVLLTLLALTWARSTGRPRLTDGTLGLLTAGLVAFAVADSGFAYLTLNEGYYSGHPVDLGWLLGFAAISAAARRPAAERLDTVDDDALRRPGVFAPYLPVVAAFAVAGWEISAQGSLGNFLSWNALIIVSLVIARHLLTLGENLSLTRDLERRVDDRTAELHRSEQRFRSLVQHASDVIAVVDPLGTITYQSGSRALGYHPGTLAGANLLDLVHPAERDDLQGALESLAARPGASELVEFPVLARDGTWRQTETVVTNLVDAPAVGGLVLTIRDVSERKSLEGELRHSAFHDVLTQLSNRRLFTDRLEHALAQSRRHHRPIAVLFLDLDGFKAVNDSLGHEYGDRVLVEVAERLRTCVRHADTVARLGGDEFAILLEELAGEAEANTVAERVCDALRRPFDLGDREVFLAGSVGIARSHTASESAEDLLRDADLAMYQAKGDRDGSYRWFEPSMHRAVVQRLELDADLRRALERDELFLQYQPIVELSSGRVVGAEALLRWRHPQRGLLGPTEFVPLAERNGLVVDIGAWVVGEACRQLRGWQVAHDDPSLSMSVNVSGRQLHHGEVIGAVARALRDSGVEPSSVVLEMTESVLVTHDDEALTHLDDLKELGVRLAVDDFGTGYSALSYLHRLPVDVIKIDKYFIDRLTCDSDSSGLAASIVAMGESLDLLTVAEGVEAEHQLAALRRLGCDLAQGFLLSRPLDVDAFERLLGENRSSLACGELPTLLRSRP
jgi:diguanylate cyclase (GGDEF)-like protein/PAS domain S-box-containing protein